MPISRPLGSSPTLRRFGPSASIVALTLVVGLPRACAQMTVEEYTPRSTLKVPTHEISRARYPFIDVHNHQRLNLDSQAVAQLVSDMDALNMGLMVNLSGRSGADLRQGIASLRDRYPTRFLLFANVDFSKIDEPDFGTRAAIQLEADVRAGAQGLKIFKNLGLTLRDKSGTRVPTDDPRLDPIWDKAGALGIPVLIHTGEPASFFEPHDKFNERWLELKQIPSRARPPNRYPSWEQIMGEQHHVFEKHPETNFIAAHLDWMGGDLDRLGQLLDRLPNVYTEIGAVLAELGRQPRHARAWFIRHQDRVLFGKDSWAPEEYPVYFRVLETEDEYFDYYRKRHAFWKMYGLGLPDTVLRKLYYENAMRIIPGIDPTPFPQ